MRVFRLSSRFRFIEQASASLLILLMTLTVPASQASGAKPYESWRAAPMASFSNPAPIIVADAPSGNMTPGTGSPYPSNIKVQGLGTSIQNLTVTLNKVNHHFPPDLDVLLVGPAGQSFILQSDAGGNVAAVNRTYTFDDAAPNQLSDTGGLPSGNIRPGNHQGNDNLSDLFPAPAPNGPHANPGPQSAGNASLGAIFNGTNPNGIWSLYVTDDEFLDAGSINGGWTLNITATQPVISTRSRVLDFDGDNQTDVAIVRANPDAQLIWHINRSTAGAVGQSWGTGQDVTVPEDYDGDGRTDVAIWRGAEGNWYILRSQTGSLSVVNFGAPSDDPHVVDDYDGDGKADPAVLRNSGGLKYWYYLGSTTGFAYRQWGLSVDTPAPGDYDGDGKADVAVKRADTPAAGLATFYIDGTVSGFQVVAWGNNADTFAPGDYDGDQKTDLAVVHRVGTDLFWYVRLSGGGTLENMHWGVSTDLIVQGDYTGDGRTDMAIWRPSTGYFYITPTGGGGDYIFSLWGLSGDYPPANAYTF